MGDVELCYLKVEGKCDFEVHRVAFGQGYVGESGSRHDGCVVGERVGIGQTVCPVEQVGAECLRGLHGAEFGSVDGVAVDVAEGVGDWYHRYGSMMAATGCDDPADHCRGGQGTGAVVDGDDVGRDVGTGVERVFDRVPARGAAWSNAAVSGLSGPLRGEDNDCV